MEDILKVLLLTKDRIVIAASHLTSEESLLFFRDKEALFSGNIIIPALRSEFNNFEEMYYSRFPAGSKEISAFFGNAISEVITWKLEENSGWFRDRIRDEAENSDSVLRKNLQRIGSEKSFLSILEKHISNSEIDGRYFSREKLTQDLDSSFPRHISIALNQWISLLYYISGARVVNCENYLPQENFVHYNLATLDINRHILTDREIFHSILMATVLSSIYNQAYPVDIIKNLSINDILIFRSQNQHRGSLFREKYEACLSICEKSRRIFDKEELLLNLGQLRALAEEIRAAFSEKLQSELGSFKVFVKRKTSIDKAFELIVNFVGIFSLPVSVVNFIINNCEANKINLIKKYRDRTMRYYHNILREFVAKEYHNDPVLLDYLNDIISLHKSKYIVLKD